MIIVTNYRTQLPIIFLSFLVTILSLTTPAYSSESFNEDDCSIEALSPKLAAAWESVEEVDQHRCLQGSESNPLTAEERKIAFTCWKTIVLEQVGPISQDINQLSAFVNKRHDERHKRIFSQYDAGKITRDELGSLINDLWNEDWPEYLSKEIESYKAEKCKKAQLL